MMQMPVECMCWKVIRAEDSTSPSWSSRQEMWRCSLKLLQHLGAGNFGGIAERWIAIAQVSLHLHCFPSAASQMPGCLPNKWKQNSLEASNFPATDAKNSKCDPASAIGCFVLSTFLLSAEPRGHQGHTATSTLTLLQQPSAPGWPRGVPGQLRWYGAN